jgi:uncharacterized Ntn-hydrolase superfamily protein
MTAYGVNFGYPSFPEGKFARRLNAQFKAIGYNRNATWVLAGMTDDDALLKVMLVNVNNGKRKIHTVQRDGWTAIYTG